MKKNWIKGIIGTISVLTLAACGGETGTSDSSQSISSAESESEVVLMDDSKLADIQEKGELIMATTADYPPYEWHLVKDGKDEIVGFEIDIAKAIAEKIGVELVVKDMDFDGLIPALTAGKVDIVLAGMNPTPKRAESVDFTDVYISQKDVVLIRKEDADKYTSKESLKDAKWATQKSTIQEEFIQKEFPDSYLQSVGKWGTAILSLNTKKVDAILMVDNTASRYADENENLMIAELDIESTPNEAAVAVAKNNGSLLMKVNEIIDEMKESGDIDQLISENVQLMEDNTIE